MMAVQTLRCPRCASDLPLGAKFCPGCGFTTDLQNATTLDTGSRESEKISFAQNLSEATSFDQGRFVPGQILIERYRVVALIGKGGMGEVYRADDLRLGHTVALKFLPEQVKQSGAALARFHREVRIARQVSHPNVCRVFDIGETADMPFLSMEYVDGEDLSSLLHRIGRLPQDKAIDIARQLCAGLAAAHELGVLHRDLKPANVMLDRRGKVRITDFGLAGLAGAGDHDSSSGTPAYMAPEQIAGKEVTVQSDIYSLGLVLYEIFTGKRAFEAGTLAELVQLRQRSTPTSPTKLVEGLDPLVERVILRCLETDQGSRPASALQVAAALPGGDPLAAALAAGETPSPEMVAAAGGESALKPALAWFLAFATLTIVGAILWIARYSTDLGLAPAQKSPDVLQDRAEEILRQAGYTDPPADRAWWWQRNADFLSYRASHIPSPLRTRTLANAEQGVLLYFYRQSPRTMIPKVVTGTVSTFDPPYEVSGMITEILDCNGKLTVFVAVPPQVVDNVVHAEVDWSRLFAAAGLEPSNFHPASPSWLPPVPYDQVRAWVGNYSQDPGTKIEVISASYQGRPVYFHVVAPWDTPWREAQPAISKTKVIRFTTDSIMAFITLVLAVFFARRSIHMGLGDRRGAFRLSGVIFAASLIAGFLLAHHVPRLDGEWQLISGIVGQVLFTAVFLWMLYIALEPRIRKQSPEVLISWSRLLSGRWRDSLVGRDCLVGALYGSIMAFAVHLTNAWPAWFNLPGQTPITAELSMGAPGVVVGGFFELVVRWVFLSFAYLFTLYVIRALVRNNVLSLLIFVVIGVLYDLGAENVRWETPAIIITVVLTLFLLLRFGILAAAVSQVIWNILQNYPMTLDFSKWYVGHSLFALAVLLAVTAYGLQIVLSSNHPIRAATY